MKQRVVQILPFALLAFLIVGVFLPLPPNERSQIRDYMQDLGHFPACVIAFWALYNISWVRVRWLHRTLWVAVVVTLGQTLIELAQPIVADWLLKILPDIGHRLVGRSASFRDWILGVAGTLFALGFILLFHVQKPRQKSLLLLTMASLVLFSLAPLLLLIVEHERHVRQFPLLGSFETSREIERWDCYGLQGEATDEYVALGEKSGRFLVTQEFSFPGLFMEGLITDWTGYRDVRFELYLEGDESRVISMRVDDHKETLPYEDRGQVDLKVMPGFNSVVIPVEDLMVTPGGREMDRKHVTRYGLFFAEKHLGDVFYLDNFRLEP